MAAKGMHLRPSPLCPSCPLWLSSSVLQTLNLHASCADSCRPVQSEDEIGLVGNSRKNRESPKERKCETISGFRSFGLSRFSWFIRQHRADDLAIGDNNAHYPSIPFRIWFRLGRALFHPWLKIFQSSRYGAAVVSPPSRVASALSAWRSISVTTKRIDPSTMTKFTPPWWSPRNVSHSW